MLNFSHDIYKKIYDLALRTNMVASCREYPSLTWFGKKIDFRDIRKSVLKNFSNSNFPCGLYVHFPFCQSRCTFCKYYSECISNQDVFDNYLTALKKELEFYNVNFFQPTLDNIFLGGGTPTLLNVEQIKKYVSIVYNFFKTNQKTQITVEATPESIEEDTLKAWKSMGVNRISVGVQSFNNRVLRTVGRRHDVKDIFKAFDIIRKVGIRFTGIDLIWGLPNESKKTYQKTAKETLRISPDYIECYLLTPGGRVRIKPYNPSDISLNEAIQIFKDIFLQNGYRSDFSGNFLSFVKKGIGRLDAVNRNTEGFYNYRSSCLGIGAGSSSLFPQLRYNVTSNVKKYITDLLKDNRPPQHFGFFITSVDYRRQYVITQFGLRRVLYKKQYHRLFGVQIEDDFPKELSCAKKSGVVVDIGNKLVWRLNEDKMGHKSFFMHVVRCWYPPAYINQIVEKIL
jgi:oxygen-independent coproporphyrinogen-3 oxidase